MGIVSAIRQVLRHVRFLGMLPISLVRHVLPMAHAPTVQWWTTRVGPSGWALQWQRHPEKQSGGADTATRGILSNRVSWKHTHSAWREVGWRVCRLSRPELRSWPVGCCR